MTFRRRGNVTLTESGRFILRSEDGDQTLIGRADDLGRFAPTNNAARSLPKRDWDDAEWLADAWRDATAMAPGYARW